MQETLAFRLNKVAEAALPSEFGAFRIYGFEGHFRRTEGTKRPRR